MVLAKNELGKMWKDEFMVKSELLAGIGLEELKKKPNTSAKIPGHQPRIYIGTSRK
jgi:hypothetical protein